MKNVYTSVTEELAEHLKGLAILKSKEEGRNVKVSDLVRAALIEHYKFGAIRITVNDPILESITLNGFRGEEGAL